MPFKDLEAERAYRRKAARQTRARRIAAGLCAKCGKADPKPGRQHCQPCLDKKASLEWWQRDKTVKQQMAYAKRRARRQEVLDRYGGSCACCGEDRHEFLALDHVNGGGNAHRREIGQSGERMWQWLKNNGWPGGFQVPCHNCNSAKGFYGSCPHQRAA